jgi:DNA-directed RNA polymerase subunit M/transcription elongation factor TFIIS
MPATLHTGPDCFYGSICYRTRRKYQRHVHDYIGTALHVHPTFLHRQPRWHKGTGLRVHKYKVPISVHALVNSKHDDAVQIRARCLRKKASSSHHASARAATSSSSSNNRSKQRQATRLFKEESCGMNNMHVRMLHTRQNPEPLLAPL